MSGGKITAIDARMIEMSGIGTYIQHLMGKGLYDYAIGREEEIRRYDKKVKIIPFDAAIYSPKEQLLFPNKKVKAAGVSIMHFPHYNVPLFYHGEYVVTVHDLTHIIFPELLGNKIKAIYARILMKHALKKANHVFTVSKNSKKDIMDYFGVPEKKISITYNAIDGDFRVKEKTEIEYLYEKFNIPKGKKTILYVGNLKPHKNLVTLLKALQKMQSDDIVLLLVGKAFKSVDLYSQENTLGIQDKVIHTGIVEKEELVDLYNLADVFVFPSLYEGFGIPPLEAMACGTPVIAANNSSIPEVVGETAILFDGKSSEKLASAILSLLNDKKMAQEMVIKGIDRCGMFSWNETVQIIRRKIDLESRVKRKN